MARTRTFFSEIFGTIIGCIIAFAIYGSVARSFTIVPAIENWLSPTISVSASEFIRDDIKACFFLDLKKLHTGVPVLYRFWAQTKIAPNAEWGTPIALSAYIAKDNSTDRDIGADLVVHKIGSTWRRHYCFELPGTVTGWQEILVTGQAEHRRHPFYTSVTPLPSFIIPAVAEASKR